MTTMTLELVEAAEILAQLGNETRLRIIRHLVKAGGDGIAVGEIQRVLDIPASTLSHHLRYLKSAGLITQRRQATVLYCVMNYALVDEVITFLTDQCCEGSSGGEIAA